MLTWKATVQEKWESLSDREHDLLHHLALGENNKTIAISLNISSKTVEFHITNILQKLDMNSRDEVIVWMLKYHPDASDN